MKVLYIVPSGHVPDEITPFSFLDEEIEALARLDVEPYVLSPEVTRDQQRGPVRLIALPSGGFGARLEALRLMREHPRLVPGHPVRNFRHRLHAVRVEAHAARVVREHGIDLIHSHFGAMLGVGGLVTRELTGRPLVATFRGMDLLLAPSIGYGLRRETFHDQAVRTILRHADVTTYASDFMREEALDLGARPESAITIWKGVDLDMFRPAGDRDGLRRELGAPSPMILSVAGLIERKGIDVLLRAVAALPDDLRPGVVLCGEGADHESLAGLARELGLEDRVQFRGQVPRSEIPRYFAACDIFVLPSRLEAAGNVLLEAMASGRPVITTRSGGPPEYVREGITGHVVEPDDVGGMKHRIEQLLRDPERSDALGRAGRAEVVRDYPYESLVRGFRGAYDRALGAAPAALSAPTARCDGLPPLRADGARPAEPAVPGTGRGPGGSGSRKGRAPSSASPRAD